MFGYLLPIIIMAHFSVSNFIPMYSLYILTACIRISIFFFSFLVNSLISFIYIKWLIFSCDLVSLYRPVHFLSMWFSGIIAITNSNDDSASLWKIAFWILTSTKFFPSSCQFYFQVFHDFLNKFYDSVGILYSLILSFIQLCGTISHAFL